MVEVVASIAEGIDGCDVYILGKLGVGFRICASTPSIIRIACYGLSILVNNSNYITLKVLYEVVLYHKPVILSSEIFGDAECEIIYFVNCEISHAAYGFVRCEMK